MIMRVFIAELKKLLSLFKSDPKSIGAGIIPPTIILLAFFITVGNFSSINIAILNHDTGNYGAILEEAILSEKSPLGDQAYFKAIDLNEEEARNKFEDEELYAYVVIPQNFSEVLTNGDTPEVEYYINNYNTDIAKNLRLYFAEGVLRFYLETDPNLQMEVVEEMNVPKQLPWFDIIASSVFMLAFLLGVVVNTLYLFSMEKRNGTMQFYQLAPNNILPSITARAVVALLSGAITATINGAFIYFLTGNNYFPYVLQLFPALLVVGLTYIFIAIIIGLCVDSFAGSIISALLGTILLWFLSGATFSIKNNTGILRTVGEFIPNTYALSHIRGVLFSMDPSIGSVSYSTGWFIMAAYLIASLAFVCIVFYRKMVRCHK